MNRDLKVHQVPGTPGPFLVDGFKHVKTSPSTRAFFLSHFHSDHYGGLDERFAAAPIYCTPITAGLVAAKLGVAADLLRPQAIGKAFVVEDVTVTFIDANHCPGAVMLLFELPCGRTTLHCGDMRYHPRMQVEPELLRVKGKVDTVYLDTTYCEEKHTFPPQEDSIALVVEHVTKQLKSSGDDGCLVLLSAYTIGKEKVLLEVSRATGHQIYVSPDKMKVLQCLNLKPEELERFTNDMNATPIHVTKMGVVGDVWPFFQPNFASIRKYIVTNALPYKHALGVIPTGWAASSKWNRTHWIQSDKSGCYSVMLSPYSEHSNFHELQDFVKFIRPAHVVPTVYSDERAAKRMVASFAGLGLLNTTAAKRGFLALFSASTTAAKGAAPALPSSLAPVSALDNAAAQSAVRSTNDDYADAKMESSTVPKEEVPEEWAAAEEAWAAAEEELDAGTTRDVANGGANTCDAHAGDDCSSTAAAAGFSRKRKRVESPMLTADDQHSSLREPQSPTREFKRENMPNDAVGPAAAVDSVDIREDGCVQVLLDMGFPLDIAERALRVSEGDVEAAVGRLLYRAQALG